MSSSFGWMVSRLPRADIAGIAALRAAREDG